MPVERVQWTSAFAAARGDKTAMRSLAKLLWILVIIVVVDIVIIIMITYTTTTITTKMY